MRIIELYAKTTKKGEKMSSLERIHIDNIRIKSGAIYCNHITYNYPEQIDSFVRKLFLKLNIEGYNNEKYYSKIVAIEDNKETQMLNSKDIKENINILKKLISKKVAIAS